jgi:hypothetical protein
MHPWPGLSIRLYSALLYLYPKEFRAAYSEEMRQTFRVASQVAYRQHGASGLAALWLATLLDLLKTALAERAWQGGFRMRANRSIALAGPLTILVGLLWILASVGELAILIKPSNADTFWDFFWFFPTLFSLIPMLFALTGARQRFITPRASRAGWG